MTAQASVTNQVSQTPAPAATTDNHSQEDLSSLTQESVARGGPVCTPANPKPFSEMITVFNPYTNAYFFNREFTPEEIAELDAQTLHKERWNNCKILALLIEG
jgi:hypothetical protein